MREDSDQMEPTFSDTQRDARRADGETNIDPEIVSDRDYDGSADTADLATGDDADQRDELLPGEMVAAPVGEPLGADQSSGLRDRWQELQLRFVDDPRGVVTEAQSLVAEAVESLTTSLTDQQHDLDGLASGGNGDTEQLRVALQRYRDFFDRVIGYA